MIGSELDRVLLLLWVGWTALISIMTKFRMTEVSMLQNGKTLLRDPA